MPSDTEQRAGEQSYVGLATSRADCGSHFRSVVCGVSSPRRANVRASWVSVWHFDAGAKEQAARPGRNRRAATMTPLDDLRQSS